MRADDQQLYFIAIIPHRELRDEIRAVKERMRDQYGAGHALKSPAHITLQRPFKRLPSEERRMCDALAGFAVKEKPFTVELNGYGVLCPESDFHEDRGARPGKVVARAPQGGVADRFGVWPG